MSATPLLQVAGLSKKFGAFAVIQNVDFALKPGARHALIGPNGAGKTTFVNLLSGALRPDEGQVLLEGVDVTQLPEARRVKRGLGRTFQVNQLFSGLTTLENVLMAVVERRGIASSSIRSVWRYQDAIEEAYGLLTLMRIADDAKRRVGELSYGRQRLVEIATALASQPKVLLLDEPAAGVPKGESGVILDVLGTLPNDIAVLMIEHDMDIVFRFAEAITVLVAGSVFAQGTPEQIRQHPGVREIYLGERHA
jgi:branched-chain amino acid transport system ATP-binding protein